MRVLVFCLVLAVFAPASGPAFGQDDSDRPRPIKAAPPEDRITFTVHGTAHAPADSVEVELVVQAQGEDAATAEKKHRDKLKAVQEALEKLKDSFEGKVSAERSTGDPEPSNKRKKKKTDDADGDVKPEDAKPEKSGGAGAEPPNKEAEPPGEKDPPAKDLSLTIEMRDGRTSIGVNKSANETGQPQEGSVTVASCVIVRLSGLSQVPRGRLRKRLARILDTAIEAGADSGADGVGSRPAFRFRAKDNEELRAAAQADALGKARIRARNLASLAGCALGKLTGLAETGWLLRAGSLDGVGFDSVVGKIGNNKLNNYEMTTSTTEIELECEITVSYEMGKELPEK